MSGKYVGNTRIAARADLDAWYTIAADAIPALQAQTKDIYSQLGTIQGAVPQRSLDAINIDLTNLENAIANLQSAVALIESEIATLQADIATIEAEIAAIMAEIATLFADIAAINATLASLQAQINAIVAEMLVNPMTTHGDMIVGGASPAGGLTRLAVDTIGKFLVLWGSPAVPTWLYLNLGAIAAASGQPIPTPVKRVPYLYAAAGSHTHTVSATCYQIDIEAWGAGGGCLTVDTTNTPGGSGGGYAYGTLAVAPGDMHTVVVGAGGVSADGGNSTFDATVVVAHGGPKGSAAANPPAAATGSGTLPGLMTITSQAGSASVAPGAGDTTYMSIGGSSPRGGAGGSCWIGQDGAGPSASHAYTQPTQPGGGGAAILSGGDSNGADGMVIIWEYQ